jgi:hypothetical protein
MPLGQHVRWTASSLTRRTRRQVRIWPASPTSRARVSQTTTLCRPRFSVASPMDWHSTQTTPRVRG